LELCFQVDLHINFNLVTVNFRMMWLRILCQIYTQTANTESWRNHLQKTKLASFKSTIDSYRNQRTWLYLLYLCKWTLRFDKLYVFVFIPKRCPSWEIDSAWVRFSEYERWNSSLKIVKWRYVVKQIHNYIILKNHPQTIHCIQVVIVKALYSGWYS